MRRSHGEGRVGVAGPWRWHPDPGKIGPREQRLEGKLGLITVPEVEKDQEGRADTGRGVRDGASTHLSGIT